ncbi:MAG: hypothetical protein EOP00_15375 [Pedobacter sp.]|nr:MAG: hypothetical protein EOP00_15375 [Pedobacter sp.]
MEITFIYAQNCPENIGFELGNFNKWQTYTGTVATGLGPSNVVTVSGSAPTATRHTIMNSKTAKDPYGEFGVMAPNGSTYSVKLGNDGTGKQAERISYLITVPTDKPVFNLTYQYAVVFQDPNHIPSDQPRFNAKVLDLSTNTYVSCASFEYIATSNLPGFKKSKTPGVIYKGWTPVSINLSGFQGKQLLLEFTTADCTQSGHFGYAYVDVNENCENIIQGNTDCESSNDIKLTGPSGYEFYKWYSADRSIKYGEGESIIIKPSLKAGDKVLLDLVPFDGFGCPNSVSTVITKGTFNLNMVDVINACKNDNIDLTSAQYLINMSATVTYEYFTDSELTEVIVTPTQINKSGIYYVKARSLNRCSDVKPIEIRFNDIPELDVVSVIKTCADVVVDLTADKVQKNIPANLKVSYYSDLANTIPITDPKNITQSGSYYIKFQSLYCAEIKKVDVEVYKLPVLKITNSTPICAPKTVDITEEKITAGSDPDITLTYFKDVELTMPIANPKAIDKAGNYYIRAVNAKGCVVIKQIFVEIYELPILQIKNPAPICAPATINLTDLNHYTGTTPNVTYTFYDAATGKVLSNPKEVSKTGTYWVNIKNANGCALTKEIKIVINPQPLLVINQPKRVFVTQRIDITKKEIISGSLDYVKVAYWYDANMNKQLENPDQLTKSGNYYISLTNSLGCSTIGEVKVELVELPKIIVPTAFTPFKNTNNKLYPFIDNLKNLVSFKVYNKWGNLVFETNSANPNAGWNGTYHNVAQPFETYTWFAEGINLIGQVYTTKGNTILIP